MSLNCTPPKGKSTRAGERPSVPVESTGHDCQEQANTNPGRIRKLYLNLVNVFDFLDGDSGFENMIKKSLFLIAFELLFYCRSSAVSRQASLSRVTLNAAPR